MHMQSQHLIKRIAVTQTLDISNTEAFCMGRFIFVLLILLKKWATTKYMALTVSLFFYTSFQKI